jgi:uncharacterized protein
MLKEKLSNDLKVAMRAKDELSLSVLRMLSTAIKNKEISLRDGKETGLNDEQVMETIRTEVKKRNDSITSYSAGGRIDLADKETAEIKILEKYLPAQLSDVEIEKEVKKIIAGMGEAIDFGKAMGQAMGKLKGRADGNKVSEMVKKILAK